jgi:signal transduction histidine kinase
MEPYFILIVDDDQLRVDHLARLLRKEASRLTGQRDRLLSIRTAENQQEADEGLTEAPPRGYDLIILDRKYPSAPGHYATFLGDEWLPKLRAGQPNATIAIATAYASEEFMEKAVEALKDFGADEFLPKTVDEEETINRLIKAIRRPRLRRQPAAPHLSNVARVTLEDLHLAFSKARARLRTLDAGVEVEELFRELQDTEERIAGRFLAPQSSEEVGLRDIDMLQIIKEEVRFFEGLFAKGRMFVEPATVYTVRTYVTDLRDALREVLQNAVDASMEEDLMKPEISVSVRRSVKPAFTDVYVSDQGPGFSDEALAKIYQPGYSFWKQGDKRHKGMGLYVARRMMQAIGGDIRYEKPPHKGATIVLSVRDWGSQ